MKINLVSIIIVLLVFVALSSAFLFKVILMESEQDLKLNGDSNGLRIVMLGNSLTFRTNWNLLLKRKNIVNRGINGNTTGDMLERLDRIIELKPIYCFVMGGINDLFLGISIKIIFEHYFAILHRLAECGIQPVIQSTLCVDGTLPESNTVNGQIRTLNQKLKHFADQNNIRFIDLNRVMSNDRGLLPEYTVDGVHLSTAGYEIWGRTLLFFLQKSNQRR